jgi:hypothetical protein
MMGRGSYRYGSTQRIRGNLEKVCGKVELNEERQVCGNLVNLSFFLIRIGS